MRKAITYIVAFVFILPLVIPGFLVNVIARSLAVGWDLGDTFLDMIFGPYKGK